MTAHIGIILVYTITPLFTLHSADFACRQCHFEAHALELSQFRCLEGSCQLKLPSGAQLREARERDTGCRTRDQKLNQPINSERLLMQPANRGQIQVLRAIGDRWRINLRANPYLYPSFFDRRSIKVLNHQIFGWRKLLLWWIDFFLFFFLFSRLYKICILIL